MSRDRYDDNGRRISDEEPERVIVGPDGDLMCPRPGHEYDEVTRLGSRLWNCTAGHRLADLKK